MKSHAWLESIHWNCNWFTTSTWKCCQAMNLKFRIYIWLTIRLKCLESTFILTCKTFHRGKFKLKNQKNPSYCVYIHALHIFTLSRLFINSKKKKFILYQRLKKLNSKKKIKIVTELFSVCLTKYCWMEKQFAFLLKRT